MDDFIYYLSKQCCKCCEYIYCGLLYVVYQKMDVKNWCECQQMLGFFVFEWVWLDEVFGNFGYVDVLCEVSCEGDQFSWWLDSEQVEMFNFGWCFDYQVLIFGLCCFVCNVKLLCQLCFFQYVLLIVDYDWQLSI